MLRASRSAGLSACISLLAAGLVGGCAGGEEKAPPPKVETVEAYGETLGPAAGPQQVAFVLLRSIADDYAAAHGKNAAAQRKAQLVTYSLVAPKTVEARLLETAQIVSNDKSRTSLGPDRDEKIFKTVHLWAPVVGHYVPSFADNISDFSRDSWATISADNRTGHVYYPVSHTRDGDPAKTETATIDVELAREQAETGGPEYWRVASVRFLGRLPAVPLALAAVQAYGMNLDESATPQQVASVVLRSVAQMVQANATKSRDAAASARFRVYCLSDADKAKARIPSAKAADALAASVNVWAAQMAPMAPQILGDAAPDQMTLTRNADGSTGVTCTPPGANATLLVELAQQSAAGKSWWRVADIRRGQMRVISGAASQPGTASAPAK